VALGGWIPVAEGEDYLPHQVTELPPLPPVSVWAHVTEHRVHRVRCAVCGHATHAVLPGNVPVGAFGPRRTATVGLLSGRYRLSRREGADLCGTLLNAPLSVGGVDGLCQATSLSLAEPVTTAQASVEHAERANADETSWRQRGRTRWLWAVVTPLVTVCRVATGRGGDAARALLGADFGFP
jgi:transposase